MKTRNYHTGPVVVALLALIWPFFYSCAHQPPANRDPQPAAKSSQATVQVSRPTQTVLENERIFEIVETPFGVIKTPIDSKDNAHALNRPGIPPEQRAAGDTDRIPPSMSAVSSDPKAVNAQSAIPQKPASRVLFNGNPKTNRSKAGQITLNFDDADIYEVIRTLAELLNISYTVDPGVRGQVTIHTAGSLDSADLFPIFYQILETNGLTAVKEGPLYKIAPMKDAPRMPLSVRYGLDEIPLPPSERMILQIIPLSNIDAEQMIKILTPFISSEGSILSHTDSNTLLLADKGANILKVLKLVEAFDDDIFSGTGHRFYKVEHNAVSDVAKPLTDIMNSYAKNAKKEIKVIAIEHLNMILVLSSDPRVFDRVEGILKTLDTPNETVQPTLHVYSVKNGSADDLASILSQIFGTVSPPPAGSGPAGSETKQTKEDVQTVSSNPFAQKQPKETIPTAVPPSISSDVSSLGTLKGELKITPDKIRNALIIEAIPSDYRIVENILERLDVLPRQVLIEAMIAEITLDDSSRFGVEWSYVRGDGGTLTGNLLSATMGASGLTSVVGQTDRWSATLSALASDNKVNILSTPTVLASNDKQARINISTEVPVASAQYQYNDASAQPVVTTNIAYRNTGIILDVIPHINENGLVSMDVSQEVSEQAGEVIVAGQSYPSFFQRSVNTTLTVGHGQTIVIGGLIRENKSVGKSGVPGISKIPIIGHLFGTDSTTNSKSELIILITPRVIVNLNDVDQVTSEFRARVPRIPNP